jgi:hypothetical protein
MNLVTDLGHPENMSKEYVRVQYEFSVPKTLYTR